MQGLILYALPIAIGMSFTGLAAKPGSPAGNIFPDKSITIIVNEKGRALIGRDTLAIDQLADELQKRLWKSYMGTGKMYGAIHLQFTGEVLMGARGSVMDAIKEAQKKALTEVCLQLHKNLFEKLTSRQQKKIQKQFPVLFQSDYQ
jgi:D-serine dehydratase